MDKKEGNNQEKSKIPLKKEKPDLKQTQTKDAKNESKKEEMEVHVKPKENKEIKFRLFLYEFFIIFLAVSVSFFVENIRERYIEHHKEVQYIQSLANDLKIDTLEMSRVIKRNYEQSKGIYTFLKKLENSDSSKKETNYIYYYSIVYLGTIENFIHTDRTIAQLKNAGGLRLIRNKAVSDSIVSYDALVHDVEVNGDICLKFFYDLLGQQRELLNFRLIKSNNFKELLADPKLKLLKNDDYTINVYYNNSLSFASLLTGYKNKIVILRKEADNLLKILEKEYDLE